MKTLEDARSEWVRAIHGDGAHCPCCDRWGKIYPRHFNASMAKALIWLVSQGFDWTDVPNTAPKWLTRTNQLATVRWWGMIERQRPKTPAGKHSGMWKPTTRGWLFAHGQIAVPETVYTYNAQVVRYGQKNIKIQNAFKTPFDYREVMLPVSGMNERSQGELWDV